MSDPIHGQGHPGDPRYEEPILDGHPERVPGDEAEAVPPPEGPTEIIETDYEIGQDNIQGAAPSPLIFTTRFS